MPAQRTSQRAVLSPALVAVCLGYFMVILDSTIVNVALPALRAEFRAGVSGLQWVVDSYLLVLAAGLLSAGALADRWGARRVFQGGLGVFLAASAECGLAPDLAVLIAARVVQGLGAALAVPASLALLRAAYTDQRARARAVGVWGGIAGLAAAAGPILGGLLVSTIGWRWVFFVNVPIALAAMALTARFVPAPPGRPRQVDPGGQSTAILALVALSVALIDGGRGGLTGTVLAAGIVCVLAVAGFVFIERRARAPMLPLALFRNRTLMAATVVGLLINLGFYGELFVINLYFQQVRHYSALVAGLALLPQMGVVAAGSAVSGRFTARSGGPRPTMLIGLAAGSAGLLALALTAADSAYAVLAGPLVAAGFGMSFTMPAATTAVTDNAPPEHAGLASGVINAARQVGSVIGVAVLGSLVGGETDLVTGLHAALIAAGLAFLLGFALIAAVRPGHGS
ncbi:DHA2 family efflux MFS transporter permease subunit [Amycolatopsis echigonensis]|uniref:DHA2 family methylenomycin A resistance protein-like MFS transporter n=1 Tax=Amycolatopsis echigonensis TaxID=2576905 RepID=A0A2N3WS87_9PSEU|nr:DHA2 family efflux MFS transporter permease subunit [Amycolatopsis niigatensis]PKV96705.1 DHA2 family methylenomycin A resistance protein-like MFS transporter [Amycolatopsis niigatensis]